MTRELFLSDYAYSGRPLVVRNAATDWKASDTFSFEFFRDIYFDLDSPVLDNIDKDCQFFAWDFHEFSSMEEVFNMDSDRASLVGNYTPW